jgi:hypothetical protein
VLGGDWNATYSCLPLASNPDVMNMQALPNIANSRKIKEMCNNVGLSDPFRVLYPKKIDFSFAPWGNIRKNRSRLDFFLISNNVIPLVSECCIKQSVQSRLFDHKAITIDFSNKKTLSSRPNISNRILNDPDLDVIVEIACQAFVFKTIAASRACLEKKILNLKKNMIQNFDEISRLELDLRNITETEINSELEKNPNFDTLHTERITPFFLKMAKGSTQERSQTEIRDGNGREFANEADERNYIFNHFANSFRKNPNEPENLEGCIENFLGLVVLDHPLVRSLKIDDREKLSLESELSIEELDSALDGANKNSAAGMDGLSTRFISRFWSHFRIPLHKYAGAVFQNGVLTNSFRCSIIKLIPKKGNASDIKKWRPISLLGCLYKVISRAVNNRLKSVINRFTSRAQKGFTNHRYIQEVLINVAEKITYCKQNNIEGVLLSIDQSRAFDTISHKYMTEVFRFYGFGENFIKILNTIGTNRSAGTISKNFNLETGRTQGDGPSPLLYNMGEQILLLKIELDPRIASVYQHHNLPNFTMDLVPDPKLKGKDLMYNTHFEIESGRCTDKADSFADDNSTATTATLESLGNLKTSVEEFAVFSGLHSNAEKTTLLQIGTIAPLQNAILELGFNVVESVTLLGLTIDNNLSFMTNYFEGTIAKIQNIIEYWERFYLSLAGRISVCKTFMLSQIGYIGSFLSPTNNQMKRLQDIMDKFCLGTMRIAKKKLYLPPSQGGLGLIKISSYITALQCAWIKRSCEHWCDNWRFDLKKACYGNPLIANANTFSLVNNPVLHNICSSFGKFALEFYKKDRNYKKALVFKNGMFKRGRNDNGIMDENFFGNNRSFAEFQQIAKLKFDDFFCKGKAKIFEPN